ncbi:hypothetical protein DBR22_04450 [Arthrobacter sp. HMWF013]|nr:hypothetical protein DBR22_04450 [Arthrobacter sp. HMWF013]
MNFRNKVRLAVNELAHQELELNAAIIDITSSIREVRKQAFAKLNAARKGDRSGKQSTVFTTASKNRFETAVFSLDTSHWTMGNPPRMAVLKTPGSGKSKDMVPENWGNRGFWIDTAPSYKAFMASFDKLQTRYRIAFGEELDAPYGLQFQDWGNPHIHLWLCVPMNADGTERLAASPTGKGARNAKYNGLRLWEWLELNWSEILGIRSDITSPAEHGVATWLARADEVDPADSMDDYLGRAVGYIRLDNDLTQSHKRKQQIVPGAWRNPEKPQQVNFWGIAGFTGKRRAADAAQRFEIHTKAALDAVIHYLAKVSGQQVTSKEINGVEIDTSFWNTTRNRIRGGMLDGSRSEEEVLELRRIINYFNKVADPVVELFVETAAPEVASIPDETDAVRPLSELLDLVGITAQVETVSVPEKDSLAVSGLSSAEQRKAARTAQRARWKATLVDSDDHY